MISTIPHKAAEILIRLRQQQPLVHNITNYVVMNFTANILLAIGVSPVMAHAENEVAEMADIASALVINIGTLEDSWVQSMLVAAKAANRKRIPVILDPVGAGATRLRTETARQLLEQTRISLVRGNASEIKALAGASDGAKGVDSIATVDQAREPAMQLADRYQLPVVVTGAQDLITDGRQTLLVNNGHPLMGRVTGTGCGATALIAAFAAVEKDLPLAAASALACYGLAGEQAAARSSGPGSFIAHFLDHLYNISPEELASNARISQ